MTNFYKKISVNVTKKNFESLREKVKLKKFQSRRVKKLFLKKKELENKNGTFLEKRIFKNKRKISISRFLDKFCKKRERFT